MRILQVHNSYKQIGSGEDVVVSHERELLQRNGHDVHLFAANNHEITTLWKQLKTALDVSWSRSFYDAASKAIKSFKPDVVHVHNFFPMITPSIFDACRSLKVPVVMTLHNYRLTCAAGTLLRNGRVCELCVTGSPYWGTRYRCYRGSVLGSAAVAHMINTHRHAGTWQSKVDCFIALTRFQQQKLIVAGFPASRIVIKPSFVTDLHVPRSSSPRHGALFVGRLAPEKGLPTLIEAWRTIDYPLTIIGSGPLAAEVRDKASHMAKVIEHVDRPTMVRHMQEAAFLVMPSVWYEGLPMTLIEAFRCDLPVVASRIGSLDELIEDGITGMNFTPGDAEDLSRTVREIIGSPPPTGRCREKYLELYTEEGNLPQIEQIYRSVQSSSVDRAPSARASANLGL